MMCQIRLDRLAFACSSIVKSALRRAGVNKVIAMEYGKSWRLLVHWQGVYSTVEGLK